MTFSFTAKVEHIVAHAALFPELAALGALFVVSAVESLSDRVLAALDKGHRAADVAAALAIARAAGMSLRPTFVAFTPWTTLDDYLALCRFIRDQRSRGRGRSGAALASACWCRPVRCCSRTTTSRRTWARSTKPALTYRWTHPDPRMDRLEADVAALVEAGDEREQTPAATFARIHRLAAAAAGLPLPPAGP